MCLLPALLIAAVSQLPGPEQACSWVAADMIQRQADGLSNDTVRYVWLPPWATPEWRGALDFAVNTAASSSNQLHRGTPLANGWLVRYDLAELNPSQENFERVFRTWTMLSRTEPYFHRFSGKTVSVPAFVHVDGLRYQAIRVGALNLAHLGEGGKALSVLTADVGGYIYRADWLIAMLLSELDGGRYYEFAGINPKPAKGTAFDAFLQRLGTSEELVDRLDGDNRAGITFSGVTAKPRRVDIFRGLAGRNGTGIVSVTHDIADETTGDAQNPLLNLLDFKDDAREVIAEKPNGLHYFALFDGNGGLQDIAPDNVARDATVPAPHTSRLQSAISCIRCHASDGGWRPVRNDVRDVLASVGVVDDLAGTNLTPQEVADKLRGKYGFDPQRPDGILDRARRDYARSVMTVSGMEPDECAEIVGNIYASLRYDLVTPEIACRELGIEMPVGIAPHVVFASAVGELPAIGGVRREDGLIALLKADKALTRANWESRYAIAATRKYLREQEQ